MMNWFPEGFFDRDGKWVAAHSPEKDSVKYPQTAISKAVICSHHIAVSSELEED